VRSPYRCSLPGLTRFGGHRRAGPELLASHDGRAGRHRRRTWRRGRDCGSTSLPGRSAHDTFRPAASLRGRTHPSPRLAHHPPNPREVEPAPPRSTHPTTLRGFSPALSTGRHTRRHQCGLSASHCDRWRRGRDSNPRYGYPYTRFPSVLFRPLRHLSAWSTTPCQFLPAAPPHCARWRRGWDCGSITLPGPSVHDTSRPATSQRRRSRCSPRLAHCPPNPREVEPTPP
jgi:hypothetical protein